MERRGGSRGASERARSAGRVGGERNSFNRGCTTARGRARTPQAHAPAPRSLPVPPEESAPASRAGAPRVRAFGDRERSLYALPRGPKVIFRKLSCYSLRRKKLNWERAFFRGAMPGKPRQPETQLAREIPPDPCRGVPGLLDARKGGVAAPIPADSHSLLPGAAFALGCSARGERNCWKSTGGQHRHRRLSSQGCPLASAPPPPTAVAGTTAEGEAARRTGIQSARDARWSRCEPRRRPRDGPSPSDTVNRRRANAMALRRKDSIDATEGAPQRAGGKGSADALSDLSKSSQHFDSALGRFGVQRCGLGIRRTPLDPQDHPLAEPHWRGLSGAPADARRWAFAFVPGDRSVPAWRFARRYDRLLERYWGRGNLQKFIRWASKADPRRPGGCCGAGARESVRLGERRRGHRDRRRPPSGDGAETRKKVPQRVRHSKVCVVLRRGYGVFESRRFRFGCRAMLSQVQNRLVQKRNPLLLPLVFVPEDIPLGQGQCERSMHAHYFETRVCPRCRRTCRTQTVRWPLAASPEATTSSAVWLSLACRVHATEQSF